MQMISKTEEKQTEVLWADQQNINEFSKLFAKITDLEESVKKLETEKEYLDDMSMEITMVDDEEVQYKIGEAFVFLSKDEVEERLEKDLQSIDEEIDSQKANIEEIRERMDELKRILYAKFGDSINLER